MLQQRSEFRADWEKLQAVEIVSELPTTRELAPCSGFEKGYAVGD